MMEEFIGNSLSVFIGITCILAGGAAWMTGQALGANWRPAWQAVAYSLLLGFADRFIIFALFEGELLSVIGYLVDTAVLIAIALAAHRITHVARMVQQYPWLYERAGVFGWRTRGPGVRDENLA